MSLGHNNPEGRGAKRGVVGSRPVCSLHVPQPRSSILQSLSIAEDMPDSGMAVTGLTGDTG